MSAKLELINGKWAVVVNGKVMFESPNKYYAKSKIPLYESANSELENKALQFPINERFGYIGQIIGMIAKKAIPSMVITGPGGLGKTYSVIDGLRSAGLKDVSEFPIGTTIAGMKCFRIIKGFSTAKGLYRVLFENQQNVVVFDDCDSVLKDPDALNLLKGALDSYDRRIITWNTSIDGDDLPRQFVFNGAVIFISNMEMERVGQALRTRAICIDLDMTSEQKIERMETIVFSDKFLPRVAAVHKKDAIGLLRKHKDKCTDLSLRSLINVAKIRADGAENWEKLAEYVLLN